MRPGGKTARDEAADLADRRPSKGFWILAFLDGDLEEFCVEREARSSSEENVSL